MNPPNLYTADKHEIIDNLYIGNSLSIESDQFDLVVNCTRENEVPFPTTYSPNCIRISIRDDPFESNYLLAILRDTDVLQRIDNTLKDNKKVLVHCSKGQQRSCAVVACYLIFYYDIMPDEAIRLIRSRRPIAFFGSVNFYSAITEFNKLLNFKSESIYFY